MSDKFRKGLKKYLPVLEVAEPAFTTDTKELYVGSAGGNIKIGGITYEIDESTTQAIVYEVVEHVDRTYTVDEPTSVTLILQEQIEHGFHAGVNFKVGAAIPAVNIINNSHYILKKRIYDYLITEDYVPTKLNCTVNMLFWCDGLFLYCQILEVE